MRAAVAIVCLAATLGACDSGSDDKRSAPDPKATAASHERTIRGWSRALNGERYKQAASFFIIGVIVDQGNEIQLITHRQILDFNQSLPCKADVTRLVEEKDDTLAYFRLKRGPGGPCHGTVRVRFTIHGGKFSQFRQLPGQSEPPGNPA
jgi:hypothetical protein